VTAISTTRAVERCQLLATLGPPPAWWRVFALRRWLAEYRAIMALDISVGAQMLREAYPAEQLEALATAENPWLRMVPRSERTPSMRRYIEPIEYTDRTATDDQAMTAEEQGARRSAAEPAEAAVSATWDEVRSRSEVKTAGGLTVYCGDCAMVFPHSGLPCRKHATLDESKAIDELMTRTLASLPVLPRPKP
jgi:hypothetical protein